MKSHYLAGKRNRRIDYIIKTLVKKFVPDFQIRHQRQTIGLEGWDLGDKRRQQILASARNIPLDSIHQVNDTEFFVDSESYPGHRYLIDLSDSTCNCDCDDFLRIQFCKHIAAVNVYFPESFPEPEESSSSEIPEPARAQDPPQSTPRSDADEERDILLKDINALCQQLTTVSVSDDATPDLEALKSVKYSLKAAIALANRSRALPERMTSTQMRSPGPKRPNAWESEKSQSGNPVRSVETPWSDASALLKASAANIVIPMLQARDWVSVPSPMRSPPLQMNVPVLLCLLWPPHAPLRLPLHARPLPLQRPAPLRVLSLARTDLWHPHLHICPQALCRGSPFRLFLMLCKGAHLRHIPPPFQSSHMLEHVSRHISGLI